MTAEMAGTSGIRKFEIVAEHGEQMLLQPHHQRMHPGVENDIGAFETHLRTVPRREILNMHRRRNDGARQAQPLGDMPLHLGAEHQFTCRSRDGVFNHQIVVGDQRLDAIKLGGGANVASEFTVVAAQPDHFETQFVTGDARRRNGVSRIAENENSLAGQVRRIDRARPPGHPARIGIDRRFDASQRADFGDEFARRAHADRHGLGVFLAKAFFEPARCFMGDFGVQYDIEIRLAQPGDGGRRRTHRRCDMHIDAKIAEQPGDLQDVITMAEPKRCRAEQVGAGPSALTRRGRAILVGKLPDNLVKCFGGAPIFLVGIAWQVERDDRARQPHGQCKARRIILNQFGGA